LNYGTVYFQK